MRLGISSFLSDILSTSSNVCFCWADGKTSGREVWEQHTVTLQRDPQLGFGLAVSGGQDNPNMENGDTSIIICDVLQGSPADGLLFENDRVIQVNSIPMDDVPHSFAVQSLRNCSREARITVRRPVTLKAGSQDAPCPSEAHHLNEADEDIGWRRDVQAPPAEIRGGGAKEERRVRARSRERDGSPAGDDPSQSGCSHSPGPNSHCQACRVRGRPVGEAEEPLHLSGRYECEAGEVGEKYLSLARSSPSWDHPGALGPLERPVSVVLVKDSPYEEYGLHLASQIFIKQMTATGLAAKDGHLQEGDIILKINGTLTENLSLSEAGRLIERSRGRLRLSVQREHQQLLVRIPLLLDSDSEHEGDDPLCSRKPLGHKQVRERRSPRPQLRKELSSKDRTENLIPVTKATAQHIKKPEDLRLSSEHSAEGAPAEAAPATVKITPPIPLRPSPEEEEIYGPNTVMVCFQKDDSLGLRLAGGNAVGIFIAGVQEGSPAEQKGLRPGDQIVKVNNVDFRNIFREEAVLFLLKIPKGQDITILAQRRHDVFNLVLVSGRSDSFFVRTHFEYERESPQSLAFGCGEVLKVVDTLYDGKLGNWLAVRVGRDKQLLEKGVIPNKIRAEQMAAVLSPPRDVAGGDRAEFWRSRAQQDGRKNDLLRKSQEKPSHQDAKRTVPTYEQVVLREAGFRRPVVIFGPMADAATERLAKEMPDQFVIAKTEPKDAGSARTSGVVRLNTIRKIIEQNKHALLDVTPKAVNTLNHTQWYPIVIFLHPDSKQGVKVMRQRAMPHSSRSARKLYVQALKLRKTYSHLFTGSIHLNSANDAWYSTLKESIKQQQMQGVWVSQGKLERIEAELECPDAQFASYLSSMSTEYLSVDGPKGPDGPPDQEPSGPGLPEADLLPHGPPPPLNYASAMSQALANEVFYRCSSDFERSPSKLAIQDVPSHTPVPPPDTTQMRLALAEDEELSLLPSHSHHCILQNLGLSDSSTYNYKYMSSNSSSTPDFHSPPPPVTSTCHLKSSHFDSGRKSSGGVPSSVITGRSSPRHPSITMETTAAPLQEEEKLDPGRSHTEEPVTQSFLGKIQAFERMDLLARTQRIQELQEARDARLEMAPNPQDIYSVPLKTPKLDLSPHQPIWSSSAPEPPSSSALRFYQPEGRDILHMDMEGQRRLWLAECVKQSHDAVKPPHHFHFTEL